ncbi:MAG: FtsQ-type POTRA domain-containing protein [Clostridia bacterium]|nr:FtsQ-type POTRA domain-containing protein [Clostridia bacterium]MBQ2933766.1 FtsQ-type POTRA domain-containing protein [Clostridia bacterium]
MAQKTAPKTKKRKRRRQSGFVKLLIALMIITILGAVGYTLSVTVFFNIAEVTVKGNTQYTKKDIVEASGIIVGSNMNLLDDDLVEASICSKLPYIGEAKIKRKYPDTISITVKPCKANRAYKTSKGYVTAYGEKVLDEVTVKPEKLPVVIAEIERYSIGNEIVLKEGMTDAIRTVKEAVDKVGIKNITGINVKNMSEIEVTVDDLIVLQFGSVENMEKKCKNAVKLIETERKKYGDEVEGYANLKYLTGDSNKSYFTRKDIHGSDKIADTQKK